MAFTPATTGQMRLFLIEGRAGPDNEPEYLSTAKAGGIDKDFGDTEDIEIPDPNNYNGFIKAGEIRGEEGRASTTITGKYALDAKSRLLELARKGCAADAQFHFGDCGDPSDFDGGWDKVMILDDALFSNYGTGDLGALSSDERAEIEENADLSAPEIYEVIQLAFADRAGDTVTNELVDVIIGDTAQCGECGDESDGCQKMYAVSLSAGGSPGTPADVVFSVDGGVTWYASEVDSLGAAEDPTGLAKVKTYLVVISNGSDSLHYALKSDVDNFEADETWTEVATGIVAAGSPNDIWSVGAKAFVVGDGGYVYTTTDVTGGVTAVETGSATSENLNAVHALDEDFVVAVGENGAIIKAEDGESFSAVTGPAGVTDGFTAVWLLDENVWYVGSDAGNLYYTENGGTNWSTKAFPGSGSGTIRDIAFATRSVGYLSHDTTAPLGRILRTISGGNTWYVLPEGTGTLTANDRVTALAACGEEPNLVVGAGLADDASDGFLTIGS